MEMRLGSDLTGPAVLNIAMGSGRGHFSVKSNWFQGKKALLPWAFHSFLAILQLPDVSSWMFT